MLNSFRGLRKRAALSYKRLGNIKVIILDPPRAGCDGAILEALENPIERIIYISCSRQRWRADAAVLARARIQPGSQTNVDMFPRRQ